VFTMQTNPLKVITVNPPHDDEAFRIITMIATTDITPTPTISTRLVIQIAASPLRKTSTTTTNSSIITIFMMIMMPPLALVGPL
jgi:hypothetical protein